LILELGRITIGLRPARGTGTIAGRPPARLPFKAKPAAWETHAARSSGHACNSLEFGKSFIQVGDDLHLNKISPSIVETCSQALSPRLGDAPTMKPFFLASLFTVVVIATLGSPGCGAGQDSGQPAIGSISIPVSSHDREISLPRKFRMRAPRR
jgi:hypothetical protein